MVIDVKAEAKRISRGHANWSHLESEIESLATRAVAEAKREQMALVLAEITRRRDQYPTDIFGEGTEPDASLDSKSARMARVTCDNLEREIKAAIRDAATEPRDVEKDAASELGLDGAA